MENIYTSIPKIKDNLLAIIAIDYGIGYASWNIYSWINSLGINSAFELQYLIAGFVPSLIIAYTIWVFRDSKRAINTVKNKYNRKVKGLDKVVRIIIIYLPWILFFGMILLSEKLENEDVFFKILPLILVLITVLIAIKPDDAYPASITLKGKPSFKELLRSVRRYHKLNKISSLIFRVYSFIVVAVLLLPYYYLFIYPNIPQELGGVKPKYCVFTSSKTDVSNIALKPILNENLVSNNVVVSDTVLVYFYNENKLIIKKEKYDRTVYEIDRKNTNGIVWIN